MILTVFLFWAIFANSWRPAFIALEIRRNPGPFVVVAALVCAEFLVRRYI